MKITKTIALTTLILMLTATLLSTAGTVFAAKPAKPTYTSFELTAEGEAYDGTKVTLTLHGLINGQSHKVFSLQVESGEAVAGIYEPVAIIKGSGVLVQPSNYIHLSIMTDKAYGGCHAAWVLKGEAGELDSGEVPISLNANKVVLPQYGGSALLTDIELTGKITFS